MLTKFMIRSYLFFKICLLLHVSFVFLLQSSKLVLNLAKSGTLLIQTLPRNAYNSSVISLFYVTYHCKMVSKHSKVMSLFKGTDDSLTHWKPVYRRKSVKVTESLSVGSPLGSSPASLNNSSTYVMCRD